MAIGSKELAPDLLDGMDNDRLAEELRKAKEELFNLRFQSATGQLDNHGRLRAVKRDIARIYTVLRERELGIRPDAVAEVAGAATDKKADKKSGKKAKKAVESEPAAGAAASEEDAK